MKRVMVFKTSVNKKKEVNQLRPVLSKLLPKADSWNFDLEDCDNILRVETQNTPSIFVINTLNNMGYFCEELD